MTNGDRIRQMSNEELAEWGIENNMCHICKYLGVCPMNVEAKKSKEGIKAYLDMEVTND